MTSAISTTPGPVRTYRASAGAGAPRLSGLRGIAEAVTDPSMVLEIVRYDTPDLRLAAAGIRLELVREPGAAQWRLHLPDGDNDDEVLRIPIAVPDVEGADPDGPPDELDALVRGVRRDRPLQPVGRVRTVRTPTRLVAPSGLRAVLVRDEITVATLGSSTTVDAWTEFELRPPERGRALADELERRLGEVGADVGEPAVTAVLDRLLTPRPRLRSPAGPKGSAGAVVLPYLGKQVDRIAAEDVRVRRDEPDAVHAMRVASRRARSALQVYRPLFDAARSRALAAELKHLGQALARARDAEVQRERMTSALAALDPDLVLGPVLAQVTRHFAREEAEARAAVLSELDGERYAALRTALDDLLADPPLTSRAGRPARKELPAIASRRAARRLERSVGALDRDPADDAAVHRVRKDAKRMRYAAEVAAPVVPTKPFVKGLKGLQKALGEFQDTVVARALLRDLGARTHAAGDNGFTFGVLYGRDAVTAELAREALSDLWRRAWRPKPRRWLG